MHQIFLVMLLAFLSLPSHASIYNNIYDSSGFDSRYYNQNRNFRHIYYPQRNYRNPIHNDFNRLEYYVFDRNYSGEPYLHRLERLERQAFGTIQQGDFDTRYAKLNSAVLSRPKINNYGRQSILKSIGDYFTGQLTGYTPELDYDSIYPQYNFGNKKYTTYSSPWRNRQFYNNYTNGSSGGIQILD